MTQDNCLKSSNRRDTWIDISSFCLVENQTYQNSAETKDNHEASNLLFLQQIGKGLCTIDKHYVGQQICLCFPLH